MATLLHAKEQHARDKAEIITTLLLLIHDEGLPVKGWVLFSVNGGAGSYCLISPDKKKQFHFRNGGRGTINVYDHYQWRSRNPVASFCTPDPRNQKDVKRMQVAVRRWLRDIQV